MAIKRKKENETEEERKRRLKFEKIANHATKTEKISWKGKYNKLQKLIKELKPIEEKILEIYLKEKQPLMDKIKEIRDEMQNECVHPYDMLVDKGEYVQCKFCNKNIKISNE